MSAAAQYIDMCGHQTLPIDVKFQMKICDFCETVACGYIQYGCVTERRRKKLASEMERIKGREIAPSNKENKGIRSMQ